MDPEENIEVTQKEPSQAAAYVIDRFNRAKDARTNQESRWMMAYRNYRGIYGPEVTFRSDEESQVFLKVTKTKVLAAYSQVCEVILGGNQFPLTVDPTSLPENVEEAVHMSTEGGPEDPMESKLQPGETRVQLKERLGGLRKKLEPVEGKLKSGPGTKPSDVTWHPAMIAAKKMQKKIHDQLEESRASKKLRSCAFELCLFGTGILKGPFRDRKEYPRWTRGAYDPLVKTRPRIEFVSIWDFYPDPEAETIEDCDYTVERHKMSRSNLRALGSRPGFDKEAVTEALEYGSHYLNESWETQLTDSGVEPTTERFEVLEFWGLIDREIAEDAGLTIPSRYKDDETLQVNIWVCNNEILRFVVNPFTPATTRYHVVPYEANPYSIWGVGVAENMEDTQMLMNGFLRMAVDNGVRSGNIVWEIDEDNLTPGQDLSKFSPGDVIRRSGGAPGQAIFPHSFPNVSAQNLQMFETARRLADESTGLPSFSYGQTGISGVGRTSSGISMLMSAANGSIRTVVKNIDDYLLAPLGYALFAFNQQFDYSEETDGDLEITARGTESLMANEVRSQRLLQFLSTILHPNLLPFAKVDQLISEVARSMDLDPERFVNSLSDAAIQAEVMRAMNPEPPAGQPPGPPGMEAPGPGSGGGIIGSGSVPTPGTPGFSANTGEGELQ